MADEMAGYLAACDEWERLVAEWGTTGKPGDAMPEAVKLAGARVDALKAVAGEGGPGDPLCCRRYGRLHRPAFSVAGCRWYGWTP
jgi:hypothetical protein